MRPMPERAGMTRHASIESRGYLVRNPPYLESKWQLVVSWASCLCWDLTCKRLFQWDLLRECSKTFSATCVGSDSHCQMSLSYPRRLELMPLSQSKTVNVWWRPCLSLRRKSNTCFSPLKVLSYINLFRLLFKIHSWQHAGVVTVNCGLGGYV